MQLQMQEKTDPPERHRYSKGREEWNERKSQSFEEGGRWKRDENETSDRI